MPRSNPRKAVRPAPRPDDTAIRRAQQLDRQADLLLSLGKHLQAERLAHLALTLREVRA